ncbi:MCM3-associated protein [Cordyceps militaris CM01]|uniref:MCM3-associated protein n=1 Tax=Cordyceps militaris (strain CM01) TaxID=983644 RepID=G3JQM2_CORMM|nr:MCM3-associated protein [Cordyceps militaris CM01]EGX89526.1 MCM3-associated protein [Cordyceps militaris CM01]
MTSPFGTSTQSSTPAVSNPFAPKPNPFGQNGSGTSAFGAKPNPTNPFAQVTTAASNANGAPNPFAPKPSVKAAENGKQSSTPTWGKKANGLQPSFSQFGGKTGAFTKPEARVNQTTASAFSSTQPGTGSLPRSNDPHAKKIYEQLRQDGIAPPAWPSQPGDPQNKVEMAKFREQYEDYRSKVRASLTRAGLIDDAKKRKKLKDAIDFKGICEDMCPEYEKITRITEHDIPTPEKDPKTTFASTTRMVKKLARSAAGQEAPLPMDVMSVPTLRKTLKYLVDDLLRNDENLPALHGYLWDRTRAIRRDFTFFSAPSIEEMHIQASVLEDIARFHVTALHLLSEAGKAPEDFVEQQELEQLGKALLTLRDIYDDCNAQGSPCENEAEFRAYHLLFRANDPNILENVQPSLWDFDIIRTAVSLVEALQNTSNFHGPLVDGPSLAAGGAHNVYFTIVKDSSVSYTMACFAECHFPQLRRSILRCLKKGLSRPREPSRDVTAAALNRHLQFDTVQQAIDFARLHDIEFQPSQQNPADPSLSCAILYNSSSLPHHRLSHQFSQTLVEDKRGSRSLPEVIQNTVFKDTPTPGKRETSLAQEGSLFVQDETAKPPFSMPPPSNNPFSGFGRPTNGNTMGGPLAKATAAADQDKPRVFGQGATPFKIAQPSASTFDKSAAERTTPAPSIGSTQQNNPFATAPASLTQTVSSETVAKESSAAKPGPDAEFDAKLETNFAKTKTGQVQAPATATAVNAKTSVGFGASPIAPKPLTTTATASPAKPLPTSGFSGFNPEASTAPTVASSMPQSTLPAFAGLAPQPQQNKPPEAAKSSTPPGSPTQASPITQSAFTKTPTQLGVFAPTSKPNSTVNSFTPPSNPPAFLASTTPPAIAPSVAAPSQPPIPPQPKRDRLLDFTRWFVEGDGGLMTEFQQHFLDGLLTPVFLGWQQKAEEKLRLEAEARDNATADDFRHRSLSLRYFYRWKTHAREKRLKFLRRSGRDQLRDFYRAQQRSSRIPQATPKSQPKVAPVPQPNHEQALMEGLRRSQARKRFIPPPTPSTVDVIGNRDSAAAIGRHFNLPASQSGMSSPARSRSSSVSRGGSKTRALREELLGSGAGCFRRSLPSIASSEDSRSESVRSSKVSERWRLKAMGIVQLPDGTAVPESLMNDRRFNPLSRSSYRASSIASVSSRRPSISSIPPPPPFSSARNGATPLAVFEDSAGSKRKRASEGSAEPMELDDGLASNGHKRVMSDARNVANDLRILREELEEGTMWYRSHNERLHTEITSRAATPMDGNF